MFCPFDNQPCEDKDNGIIVMLITQVVLSFMLPQFD